MPEGASWQEVFDASEGSTEWEAKAYEMGPHDRSFEVTLSDPVYPDLLALPYPVVLLRDARGFPLEKRPPHRPRKACHRWHHLLAGRSQ